jgi:hypothetical protein
LTAPNSATRQGYVLAAGTILSLALAARLYGATGQSLWYDEGTSVALAARAAPDILRSAARDIHPPLYYLLLAGWVRLAGDGVFALRALSAFIGVAAVAGIIAAGTYLWRRTAGLAAGGSAAVSPYLVWYSQEVRSYILIAALVPLMVVLAVEFARRPDRTRALAVFALSTCALYTHYFCGLAAVAAANAAFLVGVAAGRRAALQSLPGWTLTQLGAAAAFLPWLLYARASLQAWPATSDAISPATVAAESARLLTAGPGPTASVLATVLLVWTLVGVVALRSGRLAGLTPAVPAAALLAAPAGLVAMGLVRPAWNAKFLVSSAPGLEILVGAGLALPVTFLLGRKSASAVDASSRTRFLAAAALFAFAAATVLVPRARILNVLASDPSYARDDYRGIASYVHRAASPDDAVVLDAPTQIEVFGYYDRGRTATYPLPEARPPDRAATEARLADIASRHGDIYGILWATSESDPDGIVEAWLNEARPKAFDRWYGNVRLVLWGAHTAVRPAGVQALFGEVIRLEEVLLPPAEVFPGDVIGLEATWAPVSDVGADLVVFTQLVDARGDLAAGRDLAPRGGAEQTSTWSASGGPIRDRIGLALPPDLPPGEYTLILGLYDPATGERLTVRPIGSTTSAGDHLQLGTVRVIERR